MQDIRTALASLGLAELHEVRSMVDQRIQHLEGIEPAGDAPAANGQAVDDSRLHPRFDADFPCRVVRLLNKTGKSSFQQARVMDISRGGVRFALSDRLIRGEPVTIYLQPNAAITKQIHGVVARARRVADGWEVGMKYIAYDDLAALTRGPMDLEDLAIEEGEIINLRDEEDEF